MIKLNSITQVVDVFKILNITIKPDTVIYDIQRMHLKHMNKKDFSPIVYNVDCPAYAGKIQIIVKFKNNDFYDTTTSINTDNLNNIDSDLLQSLHNLSK